MPKIESCVVLFMVPEADTSCNAERSGTISMKSQEVAVNRNIIQRALMTASAAGLLLAAASGIVYGAAKSDLTGHWAEPVIRQWITRGDASGYPDGGFKPEQSVTRAEFVKWVNRVVQKDAGITRRFSDVAPGQWYESEVQKAVSSGVISGDEQGLFRPNDKITRQEAAIVLAKAKGLPGNGSVGVFTDGGSIPGWSRAYVGAAVQAGILKGYPDGSFRAEASIRRCEAIAALDRVRTSTQVVAPTPPIVVKPVTADATDTVYFTRAATYGPDSGTQVYYKDVYIQKSGVVLRNAEVRGRLIIDSDVGEGDATLDNVIVKGALVIRGGGQNSVHINGARLDSGITVEKTPGKKLRIVNRNSRGADIALNDSASGQLLILEGSYPSVRVNGSSISLQLNSNAVLDSLTVGSSLSGVKVDMNRDAEISRLTLNSKSEFAGTGRIREATINVSGVVFEKKPDTTNVKSGVDAPKITSQLSTATDITRFRLSNQTKDATISTSNHTVVVEIPYEAGKTSITPSEIALSTGATISPSSGTSRNFTSAQTYTVTAQDGKTTQVWTVTVNNAAASTVAEITAFTISGQSGSTTINSAAGTVTVTMPAGTVLTSLAPDIQVSANARISPATRVTTNFTNSVKYTVTAQSGATKTWTVTVTTLNSAAEITEFTIPNQASATKYTSGTSTAGTIEVTMPAGTPLKALVPVIKTSPNSTISSAGGIATDFTNSVNYVVTAQNGARKTWTVTVTAPATLSNEAKILTFTLPGQTEAVIGTDTVTVKMPAGSAITSLVPSPFTVSANATVSPDKTAAQDFSNPVKYVVKAQDGTTKEWTVTTTVATATKSTACDITQFTIGGKDAAISGTDITVTLGADADRKNLTPAIKCSTGATAVRNGGDSNDFSTDVTYTVTAENGTTKKTYTVKVSQEAAKSTAADITGFSIGDRSGVISGTDITISVPSTADRASLSPTMTLSPGATVSPSGVTDFSSPVTYTVTAEDGTTQKQWKVTVSQDAAPPS